MNQSDFTAALLDPGIAPPVGLSDPEGRPARRRFDVYRNNVVVGLMGALETAFPAVRSLVGEENFRVLARDHARAHPPRSPLMMHYGADMPAFLAGYEPVRHLRYLPDVARLELAMRRSYHAADATPLPAGELAAVAPEMLAGMRFRLAPAVEPIGSRWPLQAIRRFALDRTAPKPTPMAEDVLVLRPEFDPFALAVPPGSARFVAALGDGATLGQAVDAGGEGFDPGPALTALIAHGGVIGVEAVE